MISQSEFHNLCKSARRIILESSYKANACHIGSALSCVEILVDVYFNRMKQNDVFIFSKASGVSALYAVLALKKIIDIDRVTYYLKHFPLASSEVPGVFCSVGSLGHGLPISVGVAYANRTHDVYCLISDAECQEGTTWSSLLFARHHKLDNLNIIVDRNHLQACGLTESIIGLDIPLSSLDYVFPIKVISTIKGDSISFMENNNEWHYRNLTKGELDKALCQL